MSRKWRLQFYFSIFLASFGLGMHMYFIPLFAQQFGATFLDLGYIGTGSALTYCIAPFIVGFFADRLDHVWLYVFALLINSAATMVLVFSHSVESILILRSLGGLGYAFLWPSSEVLVIDLVSEAERIKEMGVYSVSWGAGFLVGPLVGGFVIQLFGFIILFAASSLLIFFAFLQTLIYILPYRVKSRVLEKPVNWAYVKTQLLPWYILVVCYGMIFSTITSIFPGYANSIGVGAQLIGVLFAAFGLSRLGVFATLERYLRVGERKALMLASILIAGCVLILGVFPSFFAFLPTIIVLGGCFGILFPVCISLISRIFPPAKAGAAVGSYEAVYGIGAAVGPVLVGLVAAESEVRLSFVAITVLGLVMAIAAWYGNEDMSMNAPP